MTEPVLLKRSATLAPATLDEANRTVEAVLSTGAPVERRDAYGPYVERLDVEGADLGGTNGLPLLDGHRQGSVRDVLGRVTGARVEAGCIVATLHFSRRPDVEPVWQDVVDGNLRGVSVGYRVARWQDAKEGGVRTRTATAWTPLEASLVPIAADFAASIRRNPLDESTTEAGGDVLTTRAETNRQIRALAKSAGIKGDVVDGLIDRGADLDEARGVILDALVERGGQEVRGETRVRVGASHDDPTKRAEAMGEALFARANPGHQPSGRALTFMGMDSVEMATNCLSHAYVSTVGMSPVTRITRALNTTSDYPLAISNMVGRSLRQAYDEAPMVLGLLARESAARDFRPRYRVLVEDVPLEPEAVNEAGEYRYGSLAESLARPAIIRRYGKILAVTVELLTNDDIGAFTDLAGKLGNAARRFQEKQIADLVTANAGLGPTMADGLPVFHANHGNAAATGGALSVTTLSSARLAMRRQTSPAGERIDVRPAFLLVPPEQETAAEQLLADIGAGKTDDVQPIKLRLLVSAHLLDPTRWYVVADPRRAEGVEQAYVEGLRGPVVASERDFDTDGLKTKISMTYGVGFVDHRSWFTNAGAS